VIGSIDEKILGRMLESFDGRQHSVKGGLKNVDAINGVSFDNADAHILGAGKDQVATGFTLTGGEFFGIPNLGQIDIRRKHHRGSNHRPGQGTPTYLIDAGDALEAPTADPLLKKEHPLRRGLKSFLAH
jgi:hypothetical protein